MHGVRSEQRRREREHAAATMQLLEEMDASAGIIEHLEPALQRIEPAERDILVLRYLEDRSLRDVGRELGISEDAARMRVNRALERLREMFEKEGATASSALLSTVLLSTAATAVPAGLAAAVTTAALTGLATEISAGAGTAAVATSWWTAKTAALIMEVFIRQQDGSVIPVSAQTLAAYRKQNAAIVDFFEKAFGKGTDTDKAMELMEEAQRKIQAAVKEMTNGKK
jgi:hypothetical protein